MIRTLVSDPRIEERKVCEEREKRGDGWKREEKMKERRELCS